MLKNFLKNSFWLSIGKFSSTIISFLLVPLYTLKLTPEEFGTADLVLISSLLLIPIITCQVGDFIQTNLLKKEYEEKVIYTNSIFIFLFAWGASWLFLPFFKFLLGDNYFYIYGLTFFQGFNNLNFNFFKGRNQLNKSTIISVIESAFLLGFMFFTLSYLELKLIGFFLSLILSKAIGSTLYLFIIPFWEVFKIHLIQKKYLKIIFKFSLPLVPNMIGWWVNNSSDRYLINFYLGSEANGVYAVGAKIPSIFNIVSTILISSWQNTALENYKEKNGKLFDVASKLFSYSFLLIGLIIISLKDIIFQYFILSENYVEAINIIVLLIFAAILSAMSSVFGVVYLGEGKTKMASITTMAGGVINIVLNIILIPTFGIIGAAWATLVSFIVVLIMRAKYVSSFTKLRIPIPFLCSFFLCISIFLFNQQKYLSDKWFDGIILIVATLTIGFIIKIIVNESEFILKWKERKLL